MYMCAHVVQLYHLKWECVVFGVFWASVDLPDHSKPTKTHSLSAGASKILANQSLCVFM